jgi:hypothetical protein
MSNNEQRTRTIFVEVLSELKGQLDGIEEKMKSLDPKIQDLSVKLMNNVKSKCSLQFEWLDKNSKKGSNGALEIDTTIPKAEAEKKLQELQSCTDKYDQGIRIFFNQINEQQYKTQNKNSQCLENCYTESSKLKDDEVKSCFKNCFIPTMEDMSSIFFKIDNKIGEINKSL